MSHSEPAPDTGGRGKHDGHTINVGPSVVCRRPAQGHEGLLCGDKYQDRGETVTVLCTAHWGVMLDGD